MAPKAKINSKEIIDTALSLVREEGIDALNARRLAEALSCSTQPIFSNFSSMDELKDEIIAAAYRLYKAYLSEDMKKGEYPPYKASGMAYIRFAKEEKELFKLLFMRDRSAEKISESREDIRPILEIIMKNLSISENEAYLLHLELWVFVHGIASMIATNYLGWDIAFISSALTDAYQGLRQKYIKESAECTQ